MLRGTYLDYCELLMSGSVSTRSRMASPITSLPSLENVRTRSTPWILFVNAPKRGTNSSPARPSQVTLLCEFMIVLIFMHFTNHLAIAPTPPSSTLQTARILAPSASPEARTSTQPLLIPALTSGSSSLVRHLARSILLWLMDRGWSKRQRGA